MDKLPGAERTDYNYNGLNWLSDNFAPFVFANNVSNAVKLPIDTHALPLRCRGHCTLLI